MTTKVVNWGSNNGQFIKSGLQNDRRAKSLPSVVGFAYDLLRYQCYLGNIGWKKIMEYKPRYRAGKFVYDVLEWVAYIQVMGGCVLIFMD